MHIKSYNVISKQANKNNSFKSNSILPWLDLVSLLGLIFFVDKNFPSSLWNKGISGVTISSLSSAEKNIDWSQFKVWNSVHTFMQNYNFDHSS